MSKTTRDFEPKSPISKSPAQRGDSIGGEMVRRMIMAYGSSMNGAKQPSASKLDRDTDVRR